MAAAPLSVLPCGTPSDRVRSVLPHPLLPLAALIYHGKGSAVDVVGETGTPVAQFDLDGDIRSAAWHPNARLLCFGLENGTIALMRSSGQSKAVVEAGTQHSKPITLLRWSPDGRRLVAGDAGGAVSMWRVDPVLSATPLAPGDGASPSPTDDPSSSPDCFFALSLCGSFQREWAPQLVAFLVWPCASAWDTALLGGAGSSGLGGGGGALDGPDVGSYEEPATPAGVTRIIATAPALQRSVTACMIAGHTTAPPVYFTDTGVVLDLPLAAVAGTTHAEAPAPMVVLEAVGLRQLRHAANPRAGGPAPLAHFLCIDTAGRATVGAIASDGNIACVSQAERSVIPGAGGSTGGGARGGRQASGALFAPGPSCSAWVSPSCLALAVSGTAAAASSASAVAASGVHSHPNEASSLHFYDVCGLSPGAVVTSMLPLPLPPTDAQAPSAAAAGVSAASRGPACVAFSPSRALLAVATHSGRLALWRAHHTRTATAQPPDRRSSSGGGAADGAVSRPQSQGAALTRSRTTGAASWEQLADLKLPAMPKALFFCGSHGPLIILLANDAALCVRQHAPLATAACGDLALLQIDSNTAVMRRLSSASSAPLQQRGSRALRASFPIRGLAIGQKHAVMWSGAEVEVFGVPESGGNDSETGTPAPASTVGSERPPPSPLPLLPRLCGFPLVTPEVAVIGDTIIACAQGALTAHNVKGTVKHTLVIPANEGQPALLGSNARYLALITTTGRLRVYDASRVVPTLISSCVLRGPPAAGGEGVVPTSIAVNADGTRVAVTFLRGGPSSSQHPGSAPPSTWTQSASVPAGAAAAPTVLHPASRSVGWPVPAQSNCLPSLPYAGLAALASAAAASLRDNGGAAGGAPGSQVSDNAISPRRPATDPRQLLVVDMDSEAVATYTAPLGRTVVMGCWDSGDARLLVVHTRRLRTRGAVQCNPAAFGGGVAHSSAEARVLPGGPAPQNSAGSGDAYDENGTLGGGAGEEGDGGFGPGGEGYEAVTLFATSEDSAQQSGAPATAASAGPATGSGSGVGALSSIGVCSGRLALADSLPAPTAATGLVAVRVPHTVWTSRKVAGLLTADAAVTEEDGGLLPSVLRDFSGMEDADAATRQALLDFSYSMAIGDVDAAYASVRKLPGSAGTAVWSNMSLACVPTQRLDVAAVCLSMMGHVRGVRALREALQKPTAAVADAAATANGGDAAEAGGGAVATAAAGKTAAAGVLAVQLGQLREAAQLFASAGRPDLLTRLYADSGAWERCISHASAHDRPSLKSAHFDYARHLESQGRINEATQHYEAAETHAEDVPRMLLAQGTPAALHAYVMGKAQPPIHLWYGRYLESQGDIEGARAQFAVAGPSGVVEAVRLLCTLGDMRGAAEAASAGETSNNAGAWLHLAKVLELGGQEEEALTCYERAGSLRNAVRLAKRVGTEVQLMQLTLSCSSQEVQRDAAKHLESVGSVHNALTLYRRCGATARAVELCFSHGLTDVLQEVMGDLGQLSDPRVLQQCASFFLANGQYDRAASVLVQGGRAEEALGLCAQHGVKITDAMADAMTPPAAAANVPASTDAARAAAAQRTAILLKLAEACEQQGSYHLATKKFTQAGDKLRAMKALLRSGDTERVVFFANVSRSAPIYLLAARYLQDLPWHSNPETQSTIIEMLTKAKAFEALASFQENVAAVEIDERRNYEKALQVYGDAARSLQRAKDAAGPGASGVTDAALATLQGKAAILERFVRARGQASSDPLAMVEGCRQLLAIREAELAVRIGDVFALLIYYYTEQRDFGAAHSLIESMRARTVPLVPYLEVPLLEEVAREMGLRGGASAYGLTSDVATTVDSR